MPDERIGNAYINLIQSQERVFFLAWPELGEVSFIFTEIVVNQFDHIGKRFALNIA